MIRVLWRWREYSRNDKKKDFIEKTDFHAYNEAINHPHYQHPNTTTAKKNKSINFLNTPNTTCEKNDDN